MRKRPVAAASCFAMVVLAVLGVTVASAKYGTKIQVSPGSPNVDTQRITISFKAPFALKRGWRWDGILTVLSGGDLSCAGTEDSTARHPTKKGQLVRLSFTPENSIESTTGTKFKWCQAAAIVAITTTEGNKVGRSVGAVNFRISP